MIQQMSPRERVLATLVGGVAFLFLNFIVVDYFLKNQRRLKGDLARNLGALQAMKLQLAERPLWEERAATLTAQLPVLAAEDRAGVELLEQVSQLAKSKAVLLVSQSLGVATYHPEYTAVAVQVETTSTWPALIAFLYEMQGPAKFLVFENANLKKDEKDETQMRCTLKIARWFAPKVKPK